jgi:hypothetical protein
MKIRIIVLLLAGIGCMSCSGRKMYGEEKKTEVEILRFDKDLYQYLTDSENDSVFSKYVEFLTIFGENVVFVNKSDSTGLDEKLRNYFSDTVLMRIYKDEQCILNDISGINSELSQGLNRFFEYFPQIKRPKVYLHVSGFNQNVIVTDDILSLSADKYLGSDYPLYQSFFYDYQRQLMSPDRIVPDYLLGFMMANFPFQGNEDVLLDRILYEGKLRYFLSKLLPDRQIWEYVAYSKEQYLWCSNNQSKIWGAILENQHLFAANYLTTTQYLKDSPHTAFLPLESPGRAGIWLGYQIIIAYMKQNPDTSLQQLVEMIDYPMLLKQSKYKP